MSVRRSVLYVGLTFSVASLAFSFGSWTTQRQMSYQIAANDARVSALRDDVARSILEMRGELGFPSGTQGERQPEVVAAAGTRQSVLVDEIKRQLQSEMGLFPVQLLRDRKESFVELNAYDNFGKTNYGTAGYLGDGYFVTVKHGVIALDESAEGRDARRITSIKIRYRGKDLSARVVDSGNANVEVHPGDWAIIKVNQPLDLPPLRIDTCVRLRFRGADLPARQRLLEGNHPEHRLRRSAHGQRARDLPHRRASGRVRWRRAESGGPSGRHSDRPDAGRLSLLVHPAAARRDVPQGSRYGRTRTRPRCAGAG